MIAKLIGYLIGGLLVLAMLSPIPLFAWLAYDRLEVLNSGSVQEAVIERCYSKRRSGSGSSTTFGPVAVTKNGLPVKGDFRWARRSWCESDIGDTVSVLVHQQNRDRSKIYSFTQFWLLPLFLGLVVFVGYPLLYLKKRKSARN